LQQSEAAFVHEGQRLCKLVLDPVWLQAHPPHQQQRTPMSKRSHHAIQQRPQSEIEDEACKSE